MTDIRYPLSEDVDMYPDIFLHSRGHVWECDGEGHVNIFAYDSGGHCNGPKCVHCGYYYCHHCEPFPRQSCTKESQHG